MRRNYETKLKFSWNFNK